MKKLAFAVALSAMLPLAAQADYSVGFPTETPPLTQQLRALSIGGAMDFRSVCIPAGSEVSGYTKSCRYDCLMRDLVRQVPVTEVCPQNVVR